MNKILCLRLDFLGDVLLCSPLLRSLKNRFPNAEIHFLTNSECRDLSSLVPSVDVWHFHSGSVRQTAAALWNQKFDLVIDFQSNSTTRWISFLLFRKTISIKTEERKSGQHVVDYYFEALRSLELKNDEFGIVLDSKALPAISIELPPVYDVFALGARRVTRVISYPKMIELVNRWEGKLVLLGDDWDKNFADRLELLFPEKIFNLCGTTNIVQSASIVLGARKVITHNSFMMHLAAALKKQPFVLYTNTSPSDGYAPYLASYEAIMLDDLGCRPCVKLESDVCPLYHFDCGNKIKLDAIFD